jgi:hypothetical protein
MVKSKRFGRVLRAGLEERPKFPGSGKGPKLCYGSLRSYETRFLSNVCAADGRNVRSDTSAEPKPTPGDG